MESADASKENGTTGDDGGGKEDHKVGRAGRDRSRN